ncbi:MDR family MFS transporter [Propionibacteriaceae bacterium Y1700]|uniref:MDR family MFS transporter n=1 Tax=Microlunatus sp. Y1700 TaxID=3418487 RepID=UPI003DA701D7
MSSTPHVATPPVPANLNRILVIGILVLSGFVVILNETILSVAILRLMADLHVDAATAQWVSTGFMLTMAVVIPTTGFLLQRLTTRTVFMLAMGLFSVGTLIAAVAPGFELLLVGRVVQASGTAVMMPLLMTTILQLVPKEQRGQVMGIVMIVISVAPALGPTVSGFILASLSWRWIFILVLPIAVLMLVVGAIKLVNVSEPSRSSLDLISVPLTVLGFGGLVYGINEISKGPGSITLWVSLVIGVVGMGLFVWRQLVLQRTGAPFLDLRVLKHRTFAVALGMMMIGFGSLIGVAILWPMYLQQVHHLDPKVTGFLLLPGGLAMGLLGPLIGRLHDQYGPRKLAVPGAVGMVTMMFAMSRVTESTPLLILLALHVLLSLSLAFMFTPIFTAGLNVLPPALYSHGTATLNALQQVAGGAGTALLVAIMSITAGRLAGEGAVAEQATLGGISTAFVVAAAMGLGALALAFLLPNGTPAEPEPAEALAAEPVPAQ